MPTLNWIGKDKVIKHHHDVQFRVLEKQYDFGLDKDELKNQPDQENQINEMKLINLCIQI